VQKENWKETVSFEYIIDHQNTKNISKSVSWYVFHCLPIKYLNNEYFVDEKFLMFIDENGNIWTRIIGLLKKVCDLLLNLNLFEDVNNPWLDENQISIERQSTRLYFIWFFLTIFYTSY
jgi:hypothetical protein